MINVRQASHKNITEAKTPDLSLLFKVRNTLVGEVVTLSPTVASLSLPHQLPSFDLAQTSFTSWIALVWWGVGVLALGSVLWYRGVAKVSGSTAAGFMGVMLVSALVLFYVLLACVYISLGSRL